MSEGEPTFSRTKRISGVVLCFVVPLLAPASQVASLLSYASISGPERKSEVVFALESAFGVLAYSVVLFALFTSFRLIRRKGVGRWPWVLGRSISSVILAAALTVVLQITHQGAYLNGLKGRPYPWGAINVLAYPTLYLCNDLAEWAYEKVRPQTTAFVRLEETLNGRLNLEQVARDPDGESALLLYWGYQSGTLLRAGADGEIDRGYWGSKRALYSVGAQSVFPLRSDANLLDVNQGQFVFTASGLERIDPPGETKRRTPYETLSTYDPFASTEDATWFGLSSDNLPYQAQKALALKVDRSFNAVATIPESVLATAMPEGKWGDRMSFRSKPLASSRNGTIAIFVKSSPYDGASMPTAVLAFDSSGRLLKTFPMDVSGNGRGDCSHVGATFLGDDQIVVKCASNWEDASFLHSLNLRSGGQERAEVQGPTVTDIIETANGSANWKLSSKLIPLNDEAFFVYTVKDGVQIYGADLKPNVSANRRLLDNACGSKARRAIPALNVKGGTLLLVRRDPIPIENGKKVEPGAFMDEEGAPTLPFLKVNARGELDLSYNPRLIRAICKDGPDLRKKSARKGDAAAAGASGR